MLPRRRAGILPARFERDRHADAVRGLPAAGCAARIGAGALLPRRSDLHRGDRDHQGGRPGPREPARPRAGDARYQPPGGVDRGRGRRLGLRHRRRVLHRRRAGALVRALPHARLRHRRAPGSGRVAVPGPGRRDRGVRPFDGGSRRADDRAREPGRIPDGVRLRPDLCAVAVPVGREGVRRLPRRRPGRLGPARRHRAHRGRREVRAGPRRPGRRRPVPGGPAPPSSPGASVRPGRSAIGASPPPGATTTATGSSRRSSRITWSTTPGDWRAERGGAGTR